MNPLVVISALLVLGSVQCQHQQGQQVDRQVRLEDIERDSLKSAGAVGQAQPQQQPQQQPAVTQFVQHPLQYQQQYIPQQYFTHPQYTTSQLPSYHQQVFSQQPQHPVYIPQNQPLPFPVMLIPSQYLIPQTDVNSLLSYQGVQQTQPQLKYRPAQEQQVIQQQLTTGQNKPFRPSQPLSYSAQQQFPQPQYNAYQTVYQQKFPSGVKSTVTPPLKDNYVQQTSFNNYKLQQ